MYPNKHRFLPITFSCSMCHKSVLSQQNYKMDSCNKNSTNVNIQKCIKSKTNI